MAFDVLTCPSCGAPTLEKEQARLACTGCGNGYPVIRHIIDFRDAALDTTAAFSIAEDREIADRLSEAFERTTTFNELIQLFDRLCVMRHAGEDISRLHGVAVLEKEGIKPVPLQAHQAVHGRAILDKISWYLEDTGQQVPAGIALEDGAGRGLFIDGLARRFEHLFVVDLSLAYLLLARKIVEERSLANVTLVCASVERLPFRADSFNFIHSNNVIEHVSDQRALLREARRVLKYEGLLFLLSPNRFSLYFEPHFRLPGFGFIPLPIRRWIIRARQKRDVSDIALRSLGELRVLAQEQFGEDLHLAFLPRRLKNTVTGGALRNAIVSLLNAPLIGNLMHFLINKALLGVMPYHVLLCFKRPGQARENLTESYRPASGAPARSSSGDQGVG